MKSVSFYSNQRTSPIKYFKGYINISVEGVFLERFINICRSKNIILWNIERKRATIMFANISISDFKKIKRIVAKTKSRVKIVAKKGLPFIFHRYKKRKIFVLCLILVFITLIIFSQFLWNVQIIVKDFDNLENYNEQELMLDLQNSGLKTAILKKDINVNNVINSIRLKRNDIAWIGINLRGTNAIVEVVFSSQKPELVDYSDYCNIVAEKEGIIHKISAQNGTPQVKAGQLVRKGEVLIAGWIEGKFTGREPVHSIGDIKARVWYTLKERQNYKQSIKFETGRMEEKFSIKFNNFQINLYKVLTNFEKCDKIVENKKLELFSNFYLPIEIIKITNKECEIEEKIYSEEELKSRIISELEEELLKQIEENNSNIQDINTIITDKQINLVKGDDFLEIELVYEVLENIGLEEKLNLEDIEIKENLE